MFLENFDKEDMRDATVTLIDKEIMTLLINKLVLVLIKLKNAQTYGKFQDLLNITDTTLDKIRNDFDAIVMNTDEEDIDVNKIINTAFKELLS